MYMEIEVFCKHFSVKRGLMMTFGCLLAGLILMVIKWHEREHEGVDNEALNHPSTVDALRQCMLLKYLQLSSMRSETSLLQLLIGYWDPNRLHFMIDDEPLPFGVEDMYFMTSLSRQGWEENLRGGGRDDASLTIQEYITVYWEEGTQKVASQIPITQIQTLALRSVAYYLVRMSGTTAQHVISQLLMYYVLECMRPTVYEWCTSMLASIRTQLTSCKTGRHKFFGYDSLIFSFFFERIPILTLRVSMTPPPLREPRMARWTWLWYCLGGGPTQHYDEEFFNWWGRVSFYIDEYCYTGMDFRGDLDLPLPMDTQWGDIGMISFFFLSFVFLSFSYI